MYKYKGYSKEDIKELLALAKQAKNNNHPLDSVFVKFAQEHGRAKGSVRNFYYRLIAYLKNDSAKNEEWSYDLPNVEKILPFNEQEQQKLVNAVNEGLKTNKSIRRSLMELAGGDSKKMLRFQNKYRSLANKSPYLFHYDNPQKREKQNYCNNFEKVPDIMLKQLKKEINDLIENVAIKSKSENAFLKEEIKRLKDENCALRSLLTSSKMLSSAALNILPFSAIEKKQ